jgi:hypothetical protein
VSWSLDGDYRGTAGGSGQSWNFTWNIGDKDTSGAVLDGAYLVAARAQNTSGIAGPGRTLTITLNRKAPIAVTGVAAGRNVGVVELEWSPNPERDIVGYRVYRRSSSGPDVQVCPATGSYTVATSCQDSSPPATGTLTYYVKALDRDPAGALREGAASADVTVPTGNTRPNPPTNLLATTSNGTTILRWDAPVPADPDAGDSIAFYRIYRDGATYADRYDRTASGGNLTYTDTRTDNEPHTYWVTAVDTHLSESVLLGPVTR